MQERMEKERAGLLVIDIQERLLDHVERSCELLVACKKIIAGCQALGVPIIVAEQHPEKMGATVAPLRQLLGDAVSYLPKTTFSCVADSDIANALEQTERDQWILIGIEAHVCVFQTARDLRNNAVAVAVLNDAMSSRSIYDYSTAIAELRDGGVRVSSVETILFELLYDSKAPEFKQVSQLIQS